MAKRLKRQANSPSVDLELLVRTFINNSRKKAGIEDSPHTAATHSGPIAPGKLHPLPNLVRSRVERLFRLALFRICRGTSSSIEQDVLWVDGDDEVLLYVGRSCVRTGERMIVVEIPLYYDQIGDTQVVISFITNTSDDLIGLIAATETKPRGEAAVIDLFGDALVACAWAALVETINAWAGVVGEMQLGVKLAPAGLAATKAGLVITGLKK
jgi:hypothetical protein